MPAPSAVGPYVQAITHNDIVYASGCIPLNPQSMTVVEGGIEAQAVSMSVDAETGLRQYRNKRLLTSDKSSKPATRA